MYFRIDSKKNGQWKREDFYVQGSQLQMRGVLSSIDPETKEGNFEYYHANGKLKHDGAYQGNKEIGEHKWYFDNGNPEAIENYQDGNLNGAFTEYHRNGKLSVEANFKNGIQTGKTTYYRENGTKDSEGEFKDGDRSGTWTFYNESGEQATTHEFKTDYIISEANMFIKLPNTEWDLSNKVAGQMTQYIFKRSPITDNVGRKIVPAIMVYVEDATKYKQDVTLYSIEKKLQFQGRGIKVDKISIHENEDYPLTYKNAYLTKCSYNDNGFDHILYMIHIINKDNKGIQIYMDMTKDLDEEYGHEFLTTMKSIKETK
jgi:antitoxin component YwqK of YwqJK toxin-antitoxin module